jgi:16S rRNA (guanine966-N2)-methyltransferase
MIRLTGGERKGLALYAPRGRQTRPATARIRQWLFDVLPSPDGLVVLDLFAGTGAVGLEALSRGARTALFIEQGEEAVRALHRNLEKARYHDRAQVWSSPVETAVRQLGSADRRFDLVFCDPPYAYHDLERLLTESVLALLGPQGTLVVEHRGDRPLLPGGHQPERVKDFGETRISIWTVV